MLKTAAILLVTAAPALAQDWAAIDAKAKALGNAGVAFADGVSGAYWNPASIAAAGEDGAMFSFGGFGVSASGYADLGVEGETLSVIDKVRDLYDAFDILAGQGDLNTVPIEGTEEAAIQSLIQLLDTIRFLEESETGGYVNGGGGVDFRFGSFGLFHRGIGSAGIDPFFDMGSAINFSSVGAADLYNQLTADPSGLSAAGTTLRDNLVAAGFNGTQNADGDGFNDADEIAFQAQLALGDAAISDPGFQAVFIQAAIASNNATTDTDTLGFNGSGFESSGILMRETGVTLGIPMTIIPFLAGLNLGVSFKEVIGETFFVKTTLEQFMDIDDVDELVRDLKTQFDENRKKSNQFSIDAGASFSPIPWLSLGVSAKNLIPMEFESNGPEDVKIEPQYRAGVRFNALGLLKIGFDVDLSENDLDQFVSDLKSRQVSGGVELGLGFFSLRGGFFDNVAGGDSGPTYSGGVGFHLLGLSIDLNAAMTPSDVVVESASSLPGLEDKEVKLPERVSVGASVGFNLGF